MRIVFLPGLLCDATVFRHQAAVLSRHAAVAVADFSNSTSIAEMAQAALALFDGDIVLVGFSMGGRAALEAYRMAPDRIAGLCLMDTGAAPGRPEELERRLQVIALAYQSGMKALAREWLPPMVHPDREQDPLLIGPLTDMVMRATPEQHERQIRALIDRPDARPLLGRITCPTLVMVGRQDRWSPLAQHQDLAAAIPGAELSIIEDSGHFTPVEQPRAVAHALLAWLGLPQADSGPFSLRE